MLDCWDIHTLYHLTFTLTMRMRMCFTMTYHLSFHIHPLTIAPIENDTPSHLWAQPPFRWNIYWSTESCHSALTQSASCKYISHTSYRHQRWGNIRVKQKLSSVNVNFSAYFHKFLWLSAVWQTVVRSRHRGIECPPGEQLLDLLVHLRSTLSSNCLIIQFSIQAGWLVGWWPVDSFRKRGVRVSQLSRAA